LGEQLKLLLESVEYLASEMFVTGKISRAHQKKGAKKAKLLLQVYLENYLKTKISGKC